MDRIFGIDVSDWQGDIDWEKAQAAGVKFALLKCGYGMDLTDQDDDCFERNVSECKRLGIPYGVYLYSYANTMEKAKSEAAHVLRMLKGRKPQYPVYLDMEDQITLSVSKEQILAQVKAWCEIIEGAGYKAGIYANLYWWDTYLTDPWYDTKERWVAQYYIKCEYAKAYGIWQYTSRGSVNGVNGNVDCDWCYKDYLTTEPEAPDMPPEAPSEIGIRTARQLNNQRDRVRREIRGHPQRYCQGVRHDLPGPGGLQRHCKPQPHPCGRQNPHPRNRRSPCEVRRGPGP